MYERLILNIINGTIPTDFKDYGSIISFADIFTACCGNGLDNKDVIETVIKKLDADGRLKAVYANAFGSEDLLIGVKPLD